MQTTEMEGVLLLSRSLDPDLVLSVEVDKI